jgi:hypothetical protein
VRTHDPLLLLPTSPAANGSSSLVCAPRRKFFDTLANDCLVKYTPFASRGPQTAVPMRGGAATGKNCFTLRSMAGLGRPHSYRFHPETIEAAIIAEVPSPIRVILNWFLTRPLLLDNFVPVVFTPVLAMTTDFSATWRRRVVTHPPRTLAEAPAEFPQIACRDRRPRIDPFRTIHRPTSGRPVIRERSGGSTSPDWRIQIKSDCLPSA